MVEAVIAVILNLEAEVCAAQLSGSDCTMQKLSLNKVNTTVKLLLQNFKNTVIICVRVLYFFEKRIKHCAVYTHNLQCDNLYLDPKTLVPLSSSCHQLIIKKTRNVLLRGDGTNLCTTLSRKYKSG